MDLHVGVGLQLVVEMVLRLVLFVAVELAFCRL